MGKNQSLIERNNRYCAQNYAPLPVVLVKALGSHAWDAEGNRYLDMMSAYSAVSHGHCHPRLLAVVEKQIKELNTVSRAYYTDKLGEFLERACQLTGQDMACPMNTGAEAVETALKAARKWGYEVKGIPDNQAEIVVCKNNFHGRTITIISMSSDEDYKHHFGPLTPGFKQIPYNDTAALENAITENTAAFLVEPLQGEAGMIIPEDGYLKKCAEICKRHNVLLICDEIQSGLGRSGKLLACEHDEVKPDGLILGKSLGGGIMPVSLFLAKKDVMDVFTPGTHGSTFGGNQLAAVIGLEALNILVEDKLSERAWELGKRFLARLKDIQCDAIQDVRGKGLFIGIEFKPEKATAHDVVLALLKRGILSKDTHATVARFAPPLVIDEGDLLEAADTIRDVLENEFNQ